MTSSSTVIDSAPDGWIEDDPSIRREDLYAANIMMVSAVIGILFNIYSFYIIRINRSLHTPFGALTVSRAISNTGTLSVFILWSAPVCYLGFPFLPFKTGVRFGNFSSFTYNAVIYHEPMIAIDRFIATWFPLHYDKLCGKKGSAAKIIFAWMMGFITSSPEILDGCHFRFNYWTLEWSYMDLPRSRFLEQYFFMSASYGCHLSAFIINVTIVYKLGGAFLRNRRANNGFSDINNVNNLMVTFVQTILQDAVYVVMVALIQVTGRTVAKTRFLDFIIYSWFWEMSHVLDGMIVVFYRPEMRNPIKKGIWKIFRKKEQNSGTVKVATFTRVFVV